MTFIQRVKANLTNLILSNGETVVLMWMAWAVISKKIPPQYLIYAQGLAAVVKTWYIQRAEVSTHEKREEKEKNMTTIMDQAQPANNGTISMEDRFHSLANRINAACVKTFGKGFQNDSLFNIIQEEMTITPEQIKQNLVGKLTDIEKKVLGI